MYPQTDQQSSTVFTRVEQSYIQGLTPIALRAYVATRSFSNGQGKVVRVPQSRIAGRSGVGRTQYLKGLREAQEAGAVTSRRVAGGGLSYSFTKTDHKFAAIPNTVLTKAMSNLSGRDLQVLFGTYLHVNSDTGVTWVSPTTLAGMLSMTKHNVCRALRHIERAGLASRCDRPDCPAPKPHWHLTTHQWVSQAEQSITEGCSEYDTPGCHMPDMEGVTDRTGGCHMPNAIEDQGEDQGEDHRTRDRRGRSQEEPEVDPLAGIWSSQEKRSAPGWDDARPTKPQAILAQDLRRAIRSVKPGIQFRNNEYPVIVKWFRTRIEGGWDIDTCRSAIAAFVDDPDTPRALAARRPHLAFFAFAARREGSFSETTTTRMREVTEKRDTEVRARMQDLERRRLQRRKENQRWEEGL